MGGGAINNKDYKLKFKGYNSLSVNMNYIKLAYTVTRKRLEHMCGVKWLLTAKAPHQNTGCNYN